jgi:hypothetical protein
VVSQFESAYLDGWHVIGFQLEPTFCKDEPAWPNPTLQGGEKRQLKQSGLQP